MITYEYLCDNCGCNFLIEQSIKDKSLKKCTECGKMSLNRVPQSPYIIFGQKTLGSLADKNTSKMGQYTKDKREEERRLSKEEGRRVLEEEYGHKTMKTISEKEWSNKYGLKALKPKEVKDVNKYIERGET